MRVRVDIIVYSCWIFPYFLLIVRTSGTVQNTLKCYQCEVEGKDPNHTCNEEDLKVCPNTLAADRCLTTIKKNITGHYHITRRCALAPCDLPGIQSSLLKLSSNCDQSRDEFSCYTCCDFDGCNLHSSARGIHQIRAPSSPVSTTSSWSIITALASISHLLQTSTLLSIIVSSNLLSLIN